MKKYIILIFLFFALKTNAQGYIPMLDQNGKYWKEYTMYGGGTPAYCNNYYSIVGDTLIGNYPYKKILKDTYGTNWWICTGGYLFLREDTITKKVFINELNTEYVLYDFSLQVGDTINTLPLYDFQANGDTAIVASIDSVYFNGKYHKRFNSSFPNNFYSFIEGIGSLNGFKEIGYFETSIFVNCVGLSNGIGIYPDSTNCYYPVSTNKYSFKNSIKLYPNPSTTYFQLETIKPTFTLTIVDMFGKEVYKKQHTKNYERIDISTLPVGIYQVQCLFDNKELAIKRLMKE